MDDTTIIGGGPGIPFGDEASVTPLQFKVREAPTKAPPTPGVEVEPAYLIEAHSTPSKTCWHNRSSVDSHARRVWCRDCGAELDPFDTLSFLANRVGWAQSVRRDEDKTRERLADLKREEANTKSRLKRARAALAAIVPGRFVADREKALTDVIGLVDAALEAMPRDDFNGAPGATLESLLIKLVDMRATARGDE